MKILIFAFLLPLIAITTQKPADPYNDALNAQDPSSLNTPAEEGTNIHTDVISTVVKSDFVQEKVKTALELLDFNIRSVKLGASLITRENFYLLGRALKYFSTVADFVSVNFLPDRPDGPGLLQGYFPELPIDQTLNGENQSDNYDGVNRRRFSRAPSAEGVAQPKAGTSEEIEKFVKKLKDDYNRIYGSR